MFDPEGTYHFFVFDTGEEGFGNSSKDPLGWSPIRGFLYADVEDRFEQKVVNAERTNRMMNESFFVRRGISWRNRELRHDFRHIASEIATERMGS